MKVQGNGVASVVFVIGLAVTGPAWAGETEDATSEENRLLREGKTREAFSSYDRAIRLDRARCEGLRQPGLSPPPPGEGGRSAEGLCEVLGLGRKPGAGI